MVGRLVRLQLTLFKRALVGQPAKVLGLLVLALYLFGAVITLGVGMVAMRGEAVQVRGATTAAGFALLTLMWPVLTLLASGTDQTLDPGRFALYPVRARQLMPGLLLAGFTGLGTIATAMLALFHIVCWSASMPALVAAVLAAVLGLLTCMLLSRTAAAAFSSALSTRRFRDLAAVLLGLLGLAVAVGMQFVSRWFQQGSDLLARLSTLGSVAGWTPFGWAWALPWDAAAGRWGALVVRLLLAVALVLVLWRLWERSLDRALCSPLEAGGGGGRVKGHGLVDRLVPGGPVGAVAARTLRYWRRDPRHLVQGAAVLMMPFLMMAPILVNGEQVAGEEGTILLVFPVVSLLMMGSLTVAQELSYDGSALWMEVSAGVRGRDDRLGRLVGIAWVLVPASLAVAIAFLAITHAWRHAPAMLGACLGVLIVSAAVGSVTGAMWQVPQPPPGQSAFSRGGGAGAAGLLLTFVSMGVSGVASLPVIGAAAASGLWPWLGWVLLLGGPGYGLLVLWGAVVWGGRILERSWPEVLQRVTHERN